MSGGSSYSRFLNFPWRGGERGGDGPEREVSSLIQVVVSITPQRSGVREVARARRRGNVAKFGAAVTVTVTGVRPGVPRQKQNAILSRRARGASHRMAGCEARAGLPAIGHGPEGKKSFLILNKQEPCS